MAEVIVGPDQVHIQGNHRPKPKGGFLKRFKKEFKFEIQALDEDEIVFDMIGVDASIANAFRRILLGEIPTMAIEKVWIYDNSSIIQDEVLAHRLGLVPIFADPREFKTLKGAGKDGKQDAQADDFNTLLFKLEAICDGSGTTGPEEAAGADKGEGEGEGKGKGKGGAQPPRPPPKSHSVYSSQLKWSPAGTQAERFADSGGVRPVADDILLAKLRPGQRIILEAHAHKGIGADHAKFSPVATASYRMLPAVGFQPGAQPPRNEQADELVDMCPMNVFDIEDLGKGQRQAVAARPRDCTMCRECVRRPGWAETVRLSRVPNHFIFSVESVGQYKPEELLREAALVLKQKCSTLLDAMRGESDDEDEEDDVDGDGEDEDEDDDADDDEADGDGDVAMADDDNGGSDLDV